MSELSKLKNILQYDSLFRLSGWGIGLAAMFSPFQEKLGLPMIWLYRIDSVLALSVVICTILLSYHVAWMNEKLKRFELLEQEEIEFEMPERLRKCSTKFGKIVGVFFALCGLTGGVIGGIYYIDLACRSSDIYRASTVLGYVLCGASLVTMVKIFNWLFTSKKSWINSV